jgi:hypothetical protein
MGLLSRHGLMMPHREEKSFSKSFIAVTGFILNSLGACVARALSPPPSFQRRAHVAQVSKPADLSCWGQRRKGLPEYSEGKAQRAEGAGASEPIADFQVGSPRDIEAAAGLETHDTADLEVCATVEVSRCARVHPDRLIAIEPALKLPEPDACTPTNRLAPRCRGPGFVPPSPEPCSCRSPSSDFR